MHTFVKLLLVSLSLSLVLSSPIGTISKPVEDKSGGGVFCSSCLSVGQGVISLGCNATSAEVSKFCGSLFAQLCDQVLEMACSGGCSIEDCPSHVCCIFKMCTGDSCNASAVAKPKEIAPPVKIEVDTVQIAADIEDGIFCPSCLSVSQSVVSLGCNATSEEIAKLCGNLFAGVCDKVLETVCSGGCSIEECAAQACCLIGMCSGSSCNTSSILAIAPPPPVALAPAEIKEDINAGVFCSSCLNVGQAVIGLGCNATSAEISKVCGSLFGGVCDKILETLCSGGCNIENCASQVCCLFAMCSGATCSGAANGVPNKTGLIAIDSQ